MLREETLVVYDISQHTIDGKKERLFGIGLTNGDKVQMIIKLCLDISCGSKTKFNL